MRAPILLLAACACNFASFAASILGSGREGKGEDCFGPGASAEISQEKAEGAL